MTAMIADIARRAGANAPQQLADELTILIQGALTHRQVRSDNAAAAKTKPIAQAIIDQALAPAD